MVAEKLNERRATNDRSMTAQMLKVAEFKNHHVLLRFLFRRQSQGLLETVVRLCNATP